MTDPISDDALAIRLQWASKGYGTNAGAVLAMGARITAAEGEAKRLRAVLEEARTPDLWWSQADGLMPDETCLEDWRDECSNAGPNVICPVSAGKMLGTKWTVMILTDGDGSYRDDCHIFETEAAALRALQAAAPDGGA